MPQRSQPTTMQPQSRLPRDRRRRWIGQRRSRLKLPVRQGAIGQSRLRRSRQQQRSLLIGGCRFKDWRAAAADSASAAAVDLGLIVACSVQLLRLSAALRPLVRQWSPEPLPPASAPAVAWASIVACAFASALAAAAACATVVAWAADAASAPAVAWASIVACALAAESAPAVPKLSISAWAVAAPAVLSDSNASMVAEQLMRRPLQRFRAHRLWIERLLLTWRQRYQARRWLPEHWRRPL